MAHVALQSLDPALVVFEDVASSMRSMTLGVRPAEMLGVRVHAAGFFLHPGELEMLGSLEEMIDLLFKIFSLVFLVITIALALFTVFTIAFFFVMTPGLVALAMMSRRSPALVTG